MKKLFALLALFLFLTPFYPAAGQGIDFLVQGNTYTPPFYKGRPAWTSQSQVIIMAIPNIPGVTNTNSLVYKWTKNNTVLGSVNGVGKNSLTFSDSVLGIPQSIKLEILSSESAILATGTLLLTPSSPSILVYEDNPLYGFLFNKEVGNKHTLQGSEVTYTAFPLFFSATNRLRDNLQYIWRTNTGATEDRSSVTYRIPDGSEGSSEVTVQIKNRDRFVQSAGRDFMVNFKDQ